MVHVAIVGAYGSAGVAVADELLERADELGPEELELTLIDDGDPGGGLCILRGCIPSKAFRANFCVSTVFIPEYEILN